MTLLWLFISDTLPLPKLMCVAWYSLDVLFTSSTIIHLCMISVDRYMSLKYPLRYGRAKKTAHMAFKICLVWILAFCVAGPLFLFSMFDKQRDVYYKGCGPETPTFVISATVSSFYLPLFIMTIMYIMTVRALNSQRKTQQKIVVTTSSNINKDSSPHKNGARKTSSLSLHMFNGDGREMHLSAPGAGGGGAAGRSPLLGRKAYQCRKSTDTSCDGMDSDQLYAETLLDVPKNLTPSSTYTDITAGETEQEYRDMVTRSSSASGPKKLRIRTFHFKRSKEGSSRRGNIDKGRRAVLVLGVLFAVFVIFYLPFFATYTIRTTCIKCHPYISPKMINVFEWLQYSASMVNPIIYHIFNPDFQRAFHKILRCKCSSLWLISFTPENFPVLRIQAKPWRLP